MNDKLIDPTIRALNTSLNLRQMKQNVISSNIANADTPGYKAQAIEFEQELREALAVGEDLPMQRESPEHFGAGPVEDVTPYIFDNPNGVESLDGNTVNKSEEMVGLAENQQHFNASVEMLKKKLAMLRYAISEGGGNR